MLEDITVKTFIARITTKLKNNAYIDEPPEPPKDETEARRTIATTEDYKLPFSVYMDE